MKEDWPLPYFLLERRKFHRVILPKQCGQLQGHVVGVGMVGELKGRGINMVGAKCLEARVVQPSWAGGRLEIEDQSSSEPAEKDLTVPQAKI